MKSFKSLFLARLVLPGLLMSLAAMSGWISDIQTAQAAPGEVLILGPTVSGGLGSVEATKAIVVGKTPVLVDNATWAAMTTSDFASYDAIILGDPYCVTGTGPITAAMANASVWGAAVTGNVIINGTDPVLHSYLSGAQNLIEKSIAFAVAEPGKTGLYCSLSCYYYDAVSGTPVPLLDGISGGGFTVVGQGGCPANSHIIATHPALDGLTDADLSNWSCSTHEGFESWPSDFLVLAISLDVPSSFVAPDGTSGAPYIVARGETLEVISDIKLAPKTATNPLGTTHTVTATVSENNTPIAGTTVTFTVISGPHAGLTGTDTTDGSGNASFSYTGTSAGVDTIHATFVDSVGKTQTSNTVTKTWEESTAIELKSFKARAGASGKVFLTWETATEVDNAGFNLYRSNKENGYYSKINNHLIAAKGKAVSGAIYRFVDTPPNRGTYYYKLEDVDNEGKSTTHSLTDVDNKIQKKKAKRSRR